GKVLEMIINDFENLGYRVDYKDLNSAAYGVRQKRERVIIIGNNFGVNNRFPEADYFQEDIVNNPLFDFDKKHKTMKEAIGFLKNIEIQNRKSTEYICVDGRKIYNHIASTSVKDKFWGRKYEVDQAESCDYLRY